MREFIRVFARFSPKRRSLDCVKPSDDFAGSRCKLARSFRLSEKKIEGRRCEFGFNQLDCDGFAQPIEIEGLTSGKVGDTGHGLRRTFKVDTPPSDKSIWLFDGAVTGRAFVI